MPQEDRDRISKGMATYTNWVKRALNLASTPGYQNIQKDITFEALNDAYDHFTGYTTYFLPSDMDLFDVDSRLDQAQKELAESCGSRNYNTCAAELAKFYDVVQEVNDDFQKL